MKTVFLIFLLFLQSLYNFSQEKELNCIISIDGKTKGLISKQDLVKSKSLIIEKDLASAKHIISFKLTIICKDRNEVTEIDNNQNGALTPEMIKEINNTFTGCKLYFEYIKIADNKDASIPYYNACPLSFVVE